MAGAAYQLFFPTKANQQKAYDSVNSAKTLADAHAIFNQLKTKAANEKAIKLARQAAAARKAEAARQAVNARARAIKEKAAKALYEKKQKAAAAKEVQR